MAKLDLSHEAQRDLHDIKKYIETVLVSPTAATNVVSKIMKSMRRLKAFPLIGSPLTSAAGEETDYRFLICGNYLALYRVQANIVYIDRVLYGKRDYMAILFGDTLESQPDTEK